MERQLVKNEHVLYHFNASCEMAVANGLPTYTPPAFLKQFENDLNTLPVFLAKEGDFILSTSTPSHKFIKQLGILLPEQPTFISSYNDFTRNYSDVKLNALEPWGWSPAEHALLEPFKNHCSQTYLNRSNANWESMHKQLYSRAEALNVLTGFIKKTNNEHLFIKEEELPAICSSVFEVEFLFEKWKKIVIKAPWSSSGRGLVILDRNEFHPTYKQWINGTINKQGFVMTEKLLDKKADLSFHFEMNANTWVNYLGQASFSTSDGGQYIGNNITEFPDSLTSEEKQFCINNAEIIALGLKEALVKSKLYKYYTGTLGIDVLLIQEDNVLKFQPCLEINLRNNMGTLALAIRNYLPKEAKGLWQIKAFKSGGEMMAFDKEMGSKYPIKIKNGKMASGYIPLTEPTQNKKFMAFLLAC